MALAKRQLEDIAVAVSTGSLTGSILFTSPLDRTGGNESSTKDLRYGSSQQAAWASDVKCGWAGPCKATSHATNLVGVAQLCMALVTCECHVGRKRKENTL